MKIIAITITISIAISLCLFAGCGDEKKNNKPTAAAKSEKTVQKAVAVAALAIPQGRDVEDYINNDNLKSSRRLHLEARNVLAQTQALRDMSNMQRAEIDSGILVQGSGYTGTAVNLFKNRHLDFEGPEIGKDLDIPEFISTRTTAMALPANSASEVVTDPGQLDLDEGPELGWVRLGRTARTY